MINNPNDFIEECAQRIAKSEHDDFKCGADYVFSRDKIESPIEQVLFKVDKYRTDFKVDFLCGNKIEKSVLVECDSQQFHERTEKERRYEKARDRYLKIKGMEILHYTGKEILENPFLVAKEIINYLLPGMELDEKREIYE